MDVVLFYHWRFIVNRCLKFKIGIGIAEQFRKAGFPDWGGCGFNDKNHSQR
jgi:hypothetical protein